MLSPEENDRLSRVGPGTPCGELMRRYWHPIAAMSQLPRPGTKLVRILGEDLILYRDRSNRFGLLTPHCAHRGANLAFGMADERGLRCTYHGWLYDATGQCVEQPYETYVDPQSQFSGKIRICAYPVEELGGLLFAYLGPEPRPLLPRWEAFVQHDVKREIGAAIIPCNWLQTVENAGDSSHVVSTHWQFSHYVFEQVGRPELRRHVKSSGGMGYPPRHQRDIETRFGLGAVLFPYIDVQDDGTYQIRVPVDDTRTLHFWYMTFNEEAERALGIDMPAQDDPASIPYFEVPVPGLAANGIPHWDLLDSNSGQDLVMWYGQGAIADRSTEHLGQGDTHIIQYRQLLHDQIEIVEQGRDPINVFRDPDENQCLVPEHRAVMPPLITPDGRPDRTNAARKYSAAFCQATANKLGLAELEEWVH